MIQINGFILNEKLIKAAVPHFEVLKEDVYGYPPPSTKILFTDGTEKVFVGIDTNYLFGELEKVK